MDEMDDKIINFGEKVTILQLHLMNGLQPDAIADLHNTTVNKITEIIEDEHRIMDLYQSSYLQSARLLPLKRGLYPYMENLLYCWYIEQENKVPNKPLTEKAKQLLEILSEQPTSKNAPKFTASNGWVNAFKARFNIDRQKASPVKTTIKQRPAESILQQSMNSLRDHSMDTQNYKSNGIHFESSSDEEEYPSHSNHEVKADCELDIVDQAESRANSDIDDQSLDCTATEDHIQTIETPNEDETDQLNQLSQDESVASTDEKSDRKPTKRKRPVVEFTDDSSSDNDSDSGSSTQKKRKRKSELVRVASKSGVKLIDLQEYNEQQVIRIFKPLFKYSKDNGWSSEDREQLEGLYTKSLKSCATESKLSQSTLPRFFPKKK